MNMTMAGRYDYDHYLEEYPMLIAPVSNPLKGSEVSRTSSSTASSNAVIHLVIIANQTLDSRFLQTSAMKESQETARMSR